MALTPKPNECEDTRSYLSTICEVLQSITGNDNWYDKAIASIKDIGDLDLLKTENKKSLVDALNEIYDSLNVTDTEAGRNGKSAYDLYVESLPEGSTALSVGE